MLTREQIESELGIQVNSIFYSTSSDLVYWFHFEKLGDVPFSISQLKSAKRFASQLFKCTAFKLPYISDEIFNYLTSLWLKMSLTKKRSNPKFKYLKSIELHFDNFFKEHEEVIFKGKRVFKLSNLITYLRSLRIWIPRWQVIYFLRRNGWEPFSTGYSRNWIKKDDRPK